MDSGEEIDTEARLDYNGGFILNDIVHFVISPDDGESSDDSCNWQLAKEVINDDLEYSPCLDDVMQGLYENPDIHIPLRSSCLTSKHVQGSFGTTLIIPAKAGGGKELVFGKVETSPLSDLLSKENSDDERPGPHLFRYSQQS